MRGVTVDVSSAAQLWPPSRPSPGPPHTPAAGEPIVIDLGAACVRAGFASAPAPAVELAPVVRRARAVPGGAKEDAAVGREIAPQDVLSASAAQRLAIPVSTRRGLVARVCGVEGGWCLKIGHRFLSCSLSERGEGES